VLLRHRWPGGRSSLTNAERSSDGTGSGTVAVAVTPPRATSAIRLLSIALGALRVGPVLILLLLIATLSLLSPYFLTPRNIGNVLSQTAVIATLAMGQQLVILTRGIDLSVGSNLALASVVGALIFRVEPSSVLVMFTMLVVGMTIGAVNGLVFVFGRLPHPFIITLATLSICKGLAFELSGGQAVSGMPDAVRFIGHQSIGWLPVSAILVACIAVCLVVLSHRLVWGRWFYAVGGNPDAAVKAGIPLRGVIISAYVLSGLGAGIGAIIIAGRTNAGSGLFGDLAELDSIAAVIIGGASFLGGRGNVGHALIGALMIGVLRNALNLLNVDIFFQLIVIGVVIVLAVESDVLRAHLEGRFRVLQASQT
jgi:ribose transport system permease protein